MKDRTRTGILVFALAVAACRVAAAAEAPRGPVIKGDVQSRFDVDLAQARDDLLPLLLSADPEIGADERATVKAVLDALGVGALDRLSIETVISARGVHEKSVLSLDPHADGGFLGAVCAAPDGRCRFARYVRDDDVLAFASLMDLPYHLEALGTALARRDVRPLLPMLTFDADGAASFGGVPLLSDLLPLLAGEIDAMQLRPAPGDSAARPLIVVAIAAHDGSALRELLLRKVALFTGDTEGMLAGMIGDLPAEQVGGFTITTLPWGQAVAASPDFLVAGSDPDGLRSLLAEPRGDLRVPEGRTWLRIEGDAYAEFVTRNLNAPTAGGAESAFAEAMTAAYADGPFTRLEVRTRSRGHRLEIESRTDGSPWDALYRMLRASLAALPQLSQEACADDAKADGASSPPAD